MPFAPKRDSSLAEKASRRAQRVADHVAQRVVPLGQPDAVALAQSLDLNDGPAHQLTM